MDLSHHQIVQLALECGFDELVECEITANKEIKEVDDFYMGDTASLVQFAEQLFDYWNQNENLPRQG
jgi:thymidylate synthase